MANFLRVALPNLCIARQSSRFLHTSRVNLARIICADGIEPICGEILRSRGHEVIEREKISKEELLEELKEAEGLIVRSATKVTEDVISKAPKLKFIGRAGTGYENIDVVSATRKGVIVMNTPGGNTISTAELAMSFIMALSRNIPQACASLKAGKWERSSFKGTELSGKTIGIIGLGRIGREVANWCRKFGMITVGYDPVLSAAVAKAANIEPVSLEALYNRSDFITVHCPLTRDTRHLIDSKALSQCKTGVRIINAARGGIVDEEALLDSLNKEKVAGAALDVFETEPPSSERAPLLNHPRVICTPHLGASTNEAQTRVARDIATQFANAFDNLSFSGAVNAPTVDIAFDKTISPYIALSERLGSIQAQLLKGQLQKIKITCKGKDFAEKPNVVSAVTSAVLKGLLSHVLISEVNMINAPLLAQEMGIQVSESVERQSTDYSNLITIEFATDKEERVIGGTVFGDRSFRIVQFDDYKVEIEPDGELLFFNNLDQPGILKGVTMLLASASINIAKFTLGRHDRGGQALGVITADEKIPEHVLGQIKRLDNIRNVGNATLAHFSTTTTDFDSTKPPIRPSDPNFGSGPCKKFPGWSLNAIQDAPLGRSHRSTIGKSKLFQAIEETKILLDLPKDYRVGIVPASDTGAFEMAMWSLLGPRPVDIFHWESFGKGWFTDINKQLKLENVHEYKAEYGDIPDLAQHKSDHDAIFTWNGTTSGVKVPHADWISDNREGLTLCDATSAVFAMEMPWEKLDVVTYSWQKVLGGEGAHGILILSPRAVERLESYSPKWPMPKIFRMTKNGKLDEEIFKGSTINTPSMMCVEDYLAALQWANSIGGLSALFQRSKENLRVIERFVAEHSWIDFLAKDPAIRSNTSICLSLDLKKDQIKKMVKLLEDEVIAYDIGSYRDAPPGLRIWGGATVENADMEALMPWIYWAFQKAKSQ